MLPVLPDTTAKASWRELLLSPRLLPAVFGRYVLSSLLTAGVDYLVFMLVFPMLGSVLGSIFLARAASLLVNYILARFVVFFSADRVRKTFPRFAAVVIVSGLATSGLIGVFTARWQLPVLQAKMVAELLLYMVNFTILDRLVFARRKSSSGKVQWD
jgi:putative flippase GtrA